MSLLQRPTAPSNVLGAFDLWELTTLYQEVHGSAYWYLDVDPVLGVPRNVWILPAQNVTPRREPDSPNVVDYYQYRTGGRDQRFAPEQVVHFRYPDPRDPYTSGLSPLRACFEQASTAGDYAAFTAMYVAAGTPDDGTRRLPLVPADIGFVPVSGVGYVAANGADAGADIVAERSIRNDEGCIATMATKMPMTTARPMRM